MTESPYTAAMPKAVVGVVGGMLNTKLGRVRAQVENEHSTNLREELDHRHDETRRWFAWLATRLDQVENVVRTQDNRIRHIEDTTGRRN